MIDPDEREAGFYWISLDGQEAEVAEWSLEWGAWLVVGRVSVLTDAMGLDVAVLGGRLAPPPRTVRNAAVRFSPADQTMI